MTTVPDVVLNTGLPIPQLGFGTFQVPNEDVGAAVRTALETGYRSIDTAAAYRNEQGVGEAIRASGLPREDVFLTTKVWNNDHGYDETLRAVNASLDRLKLDYVDLFLIHWPAPAADRYVPTWRALEKAHAEGRIRSIGVSNFQRAHLRRLLDETEIVPAVNQIELHPNLSQVELREFHAEHGIVTEAWSPLGQGGALLDDPVIADVAGKHRKSPAQVILRWHMELGNVAIPKSVTPARIKENIEIFDFALDEEDLAALGGLDNGTRLGPNPDNFG
jgi:diketogulonate reductase-like aldo/keto reductase